MRKFADLYVEQENKVRTIYKVASLLKQAKDQNDAEQQPAKQREQKHPKDQGPKSGRRRTGKYHAQRLGSLTSTAGTTLLATLLGAITGGIANGWEGAGKGAAIGAGTGGGLSLTMNAGGKALGALVGPRTLAKQKKYDESKGQTALNYLLPGAATFSRERTLATSEDEQQALERQRLLKGASYRGLYKRAADQKAYTQMSDEEKQEYMLARLKRARRKDAWGRWGGLGLGGTFRGFADELQLQQLRDPETFNRIRERIINL